MIRIARVDGQRERAARKDARVDRRPRGAAIVRAKDAAACVGVMGGGLLRRQHESRRKRHPRAMPSMQGLPLSKNPMGPSPHPRALGPETATAQRYFMTVCGGITDLHWLGGVLSGLTGTWVASPLASVSSAAREQLPPGMFHQFDVIG